MSQQLALFDPLAARFTRECIRCGQKMKGHSFTTVYGIFVNAAGARIPVCGEPLHVRCPPHGAPPREVWHDPSLEGRPRTVSRQGKRVAPEIFLEQSGRFSARVGRQRVGTHDTLEQAQAARQLYLGERGSTERQRRRKERQS